jgi:hypothetical protein
MNDFSIIEYTFSSLKITTNCLWLNFFWEQQSNNLDEIDSLLNHPLFTIKNIDGLILSTDDNKLLKHLIIKYGENFKWIGISIEINESEKHFVVVRSNLKNLKTGIVINRKNLNFTSRIYISYKA